ncbi:uncharacterized protein LY89DRAFT_741117 [Mollisia scopiformis]|uniref:YjgF-like protein n=1 Tax=Mollisia scopiformis TaxID=149040 RepID=A0A132BC24_MOLSC|nr:uncharacterized protein LY89DRAFT_741117 [Mollisia scopiformis]KUJ09404.1 hypothetical protein LY89DRAFT_741117 [Mollisia scopiformis]
MANLTHFNPKASSKPYMGLFSNCTIVPPNTALAYISTQWAADPSTGELVEGAAGDYTKQSKIVWTNLVETLKELGAQMKDVVHTTVSFSEFNDDIGKAVVEAWVSVMPDEWKQDMFKPSLTFNGVSIFHRPGVVYAVDLVVAVPSK